MKTKPITRIFLTLLLLGIFTSCEKDKKSEYTVEDQPATGILTYVQTGFIPLAVDPVTLQPLTASISMQGTGTITNLGKLTMVSTFKFDFVAGKGSDFVTAYTGENPADSFVATGSSQMTQNMEFTVTESFSSGKGRFAKIKGGGLTYVVLLPDGSSGTGTTEWKVTY